MRVDLYLDGYLGMWALSKTNSDQIGTVVTTDPAVCEYAQARGITAVADPFSKLDFPPQQMALSVHYHRIFSTDYLSKYDKMYNLHPGLLPWGRGYYPVFWAIWEGTPAGATLHEIDAGIDSGPIVAQLEVPYSVHDTGGTLHKRVREAEQNLFTEYFSRIIAGESLSSCEQMQGGTYHSKADFISIKQEIHSNRMTAADSNRLQRALMFP